MYVKPPEIFVWRVLNGGTAKPPQTISHYAD